MPFLHEVPSLDICEWIKVKNLPETFLKITSNQSMWNTLYPIIRKSIQSYMCLHKKYDFINVLQDIVHSYNHTQHHSIGMSPSEVKPGDVEKSLWWHLYKPNEVFYKWKACVMTDNISCLTHKSPLRKLNSRLTVLQFIVKQNLTTNYI